MSRRIEVSIDLPAPPEVVWDDIARLESHVEWMTDAESIEFVGESTTGAGTTMQVATRVGPFRLADVMEFTEWEPPRRMAIRHEGIVTGTGEFLLEPSGAGTRFTWREELSFPPYLGGPLTELLAAPVLRWVWRRNLDRLRARFEKPPTSR